MYSFYKKITHRQGFTIIELLVVIAIVGILASVALGPFAKSQATARDRARQSDLKNLSLAVTLYKEANDRYPEVGCNASAGDWAGPNNSSDPGFHSTGCTNWIKNLDSRFIGELPKDPRFSETNKGYYYRTNANGTEYKIILKDVVEQITITSDTDNFARYDSSCSGSSPANDYAVYYDNNPSQNNGAECW